MDTFTPECIQSLIAQLRANKKVTITEIKDEGGAVRVLGSARINYMPVDRDAVQVGNEAYGTLLYLKKV